MRRLAVALALVFVCLNAHLALAGANHSARAWVTWDRAGLVPTLFATHLDSASVYVHIEGASDISALAVYLMYSVSGDSTATLESASPDGQGGWAQRTSAATSFLGDSTYNWTIHFNPGDERVKIKYNFESTVHSDTLSGSVWIQEILAQDGGGAIDTIRVVGAASIQGNELPGFQVPTDSLPGMAIVRFANDVIAPTVANAKMVFPEDFSNSTLRDSLMSYVGYSLGQHVFPGAPDGETTRVGANGDTVSCIDESQFVVLKLSDAIPLATLLSRLRTLSGVVSACPVAALANLRQPNDPSFPQQWYLQQSGPAALGAPQAWDNVVGLSGLMIGIIDSGVDYHHPDLDPNQDQSRLIRGYDYGDGDRDVYDDTPQNDRGHGTAVSGIVGALTDNGVGVSGIMWQGKVLMEKSAQNVGVCPQACFSFHPSYAVAAAIDDAVRRGAKAINLSIGYPGHPAPDAHGFIDYGIVGMALRAALLLAGNDPVAVATYNAYRVGTVVCAAAGNDGSQNIDLPAAYPWVVSVGASDENGNRTSWSDYGSRLDFLAPGIDVLSTTMWDTQNGYAYFAGTSASAPMATGSAALVWAESANRGSGLSNEDVMNLLKLSARPIGGAGRTDASGYGYLDVSRALSRLRAPYRIVRGLVVGGTSTLVNGTHKMTMIGNGGLPGSDYWGDTYEVRSHVNFCGTLTEDPMIWGRERDSNAWTAANPNSELPYSRVENVTRDGFDIVGYVFYVRSDVGSRQINQWWPAAPGAARMAYTASTRNGLGGVTIVGPTSTCQGMWTANVCGGEGELSYQWYTRAIGGAWSGVVGTGPSFTAQIPGHDIEMKVVANSNGVAVENVLPVHYVICTVSAPSQGEPLALRLAVGPNPFASRVRLSVEMPRRGRADLEIFDVGGRLVATLFSGEMGAGVHEYEWRPSELLGGAHAGLYFARLVTPEGTRRTRLAVVR